MKKQQKPSKNQKDKKQPKEQIEFGGAWGKGPWVSICGFGFFGFFGFLHVYCIFIKMCGFAW